jgi:hypothetical protein
MLKHLQKILTVLAVAVHWWPASAAADRLVTHYFEGEVNFSTSDSVQVGDRITGTFTYDLDWEDRLAGNPTSFFHLFPPGWAAERFPSGSPIGMSYTVGSLSHHTTELAELTLRNDSSGEDTLYFGSDALMGPSGPCCVGGYIELLDPTGTALSSDRPPARLDFAAFASSTFWGTDGRADFLATIDTLYRVTRAPLQTIALTGEPGSDAGGPLWFPSDTKLALNDAGQVAFVATHLDAGGALESSLFRGDGQSLTEIVRSGQSLDETGATLGGVEHWLLNDRGDVAFAGVLDNAIGVFRGDGEHLTQIAREPQVDFMLDAINRAGQVTFGALDRGEQGDVQDWTLYLGNGLERTLIATKDMHTPHGILGPVRGRALLNDSGQVAFAGLPLGIFRWEDEVLTPIAVEGQQAPNGNGTFSFLEPEFLSYGTVHSINNAGRVLFLGRLSGATGGDADGLFLGDGAGLTEIIRDGQVVPDGDRTFSRLDLTFPKLNERGQVAILHLTGLFLFSDGVVKRVLSPGQPAPDGNGTIRGWASLAELGRMDLNDSGQIALAVPFEGAGGSSAEETALYLIHGTEVTELVRSGDVLDLGGGDVRRIRFIFGGANLNNHGQVAFTAQFTDGTSGVFVTTVPGPATLGAPLLHPGNTFRFTLNGTPGHDYGIETSADLSVWTPLYTYTMGPDGTLEVILALDTAEGERFYRAQWRR